MATHTETLAIAIEHLRNGRLQEAEQVYRRILATEPNQADAWHLLGVVALHAGRYAIAVEHIKRAIALNGADAAAHNNLGEAYRSLKRVPEAVAAYQRALELKPDYAEVHNNLGDALKDQGKLDEAVAHYRRAVQRKPDFTKAEYNLGNALRQQGKLEEAAACYRRVLQRMPEVAEAHNNLGGVLREQGKPDESIACYRRVLQLKPDFAEAHDNLGAALEELGDLQGAEDSFRATLRHDPRSALAHYNLANLLGGSLPDADLAALRRLFADTELSDVQRMLLHFGLARVLDGRGEFSAASEHLEPANSLQLAEWRKCGQEYDPKEYASLVRQTMSICTPEFFERLRGFGLKTEVPVFVVGLPRTGTTLVEQILASHARVFGAGEIKLARDSMNALRGRKADRFDGLRRLNGPTARSLAMWHLARLQELNRGAVRIVDKMPDNYLFLGLLAVLFPRARFIHCRRDLRDVALSCWMTFFKEINWASDQQHIVSRFREHARMMDHWRKVLPTPMLEIDYEETVSDLEGVARKLVAWCGLEWQPECVEFHKTKRTIRTASAVQVRQPIFKTSVSRWKHYEQCLAPLFARLEVAANQSRPN